MKTYKEFKMQINEISVQSLSKAAVLAQRKSKIAKRSGEYPEADKRTNQSKRFVSRIKKLDNKIVKKVIDGTPMYNDPDTGEYFPTNTVDKIKNS